jgi:hypothetical protein
MAAMGNAKYALDRAHGTAHASADDTSDCATHRSGDPVTFVRTFLSAAHDALGVARTRQARQGQNDSGACKEQAAR